VPSIMRQASITGSKNMKSSDHQYFLDNTDFFQPLEEIAEAIRNNEGISGISNQELIALVNSRPDMLERLQKYL